MSADASDVELSKSERLFIGVMTTIAMALIKLHGTDGPEHVGSAIAKASAACGVHQYNRLGRLRLENQTMIAVAHERLKAVKPDTTGSDS